MDASARGSCTKSDVEVLAGPGERPVIPYADVVKLLFTILSRVLRQCRRRGLMGG